ncbi:MAG: DUF3256 family protein [Bacteroides sp.]|nr:DUF3256 family protein [Bacteroides sp.]
MKKLAILLMFLPLMAVARSVSEYFLAAPMDLVGYVDETARLDMIDYFNAGQTDRAPMSSRNLRVKLTELTDTAMTLKAGDVQTISLRLLPAKSDTVIAVIETMATPALDSKLTIYNKEWKPIPKAWNAPADKEWGKHEASFLLTEYHLEGDTLTLIDNTAQWDEQVAPAVKQLKYVWQPKSVKFKRLK